MRNSTVISLINFFKEAINNNRTLEEQCTISKKSVSSVRNSVYTIKKSLDTTNELFQEAISLYSTLVKTRGGWDKTFTKEPTNIVNVETDDASEINYERNSEGKIMYYSYKIYRRDKSALIGKLTREEMNSIYRLYSYYGDSFQQRIISRQFPDLSLIDFKRILRAFNITKASSPFAPHMYEEYSEDTLREMQLREKENSFLRKAEEDAIKNNEKLLKKYSQENIELKKQIENMSQFKIAIPEHITPVKINKNPMTGEDLILHLSDLHIGACLTTGAMYNENLNYGIDEAHRRLTEVLYRVSNLGNFDTIIINLLGDNIDCCGFTGKTARLDHAMPNNMDAREQANAYINLILWFIDSLISNKVCSHIKVYSVPCGNHGGSFEYMVNKAILAMINARFPEIETTLFEEFFGTYEFKQNTFVLCHGKDDQYMKRGLPLNLDEKSKTMLYEWMDYTGIKGNQIHFIKGDLHSNNINSCHKFSYRNVLSMFGASDYANYNFSRNSYGVSYELFIGNNLIRGTFENI